MAPESIHTNHTLPGATTLSARGYRSVTSEPALVRWILIGFASAFLMIFLMLPLVVVFAQAFAGGARVYLAALIDADAIAAIILTLKVAAIAVLLNTTFGVAAAWAVAKFEFRGKNVLITLIDLPFSISPVISGMVFVLVFGAQTWVGGWMIDHGVRVIFAQSGLVLATLFVTFPFVARELIPLMQAQGSDEEYAALSLGASGWQTFWHVTLPNIRWGLLYGILLCNARAMGEFGAVSVVSGKIRGMSNTMPLHVQVLYEDNMMVAAFAVASLLALLSLLTLGLRSFLEWRHGDELAAMRGR